MGWCNIIEFSRNFIMDMSTEVTHATRNWVYYRDAISIIMISGTIFAQFCGCTFLSYFIGMSGDSFKFGTMQASS